MNTPVNVQLIRAALAEDMARNDVTTLALVPSNAVAQARFVAKADGIVCGMDMCAATFKLLDRRCLVTARTRDGNRVRAGQIIAIVKGPARALLTGERTALNFLQHLSGISTITSRFVEKVKGTGARIYDTRKTIPGMRELAKYAVRCGGGMNHRRGLGDMVLIKDNHLVYVKDLSEAVRAVRSKHPSREVEVECETLPQVKAALDAGVDIIMLDNMTVSMLKRSLSLIKSAVSLKGKERPRTEISGGVSLVTVRTYAKLGVDRISIGALTHSAAALDISLEFDQ